MAAGSCGHASNQWAGLAVPTLLSVVTCPGLAVLTLLSVVTCPGLAVLTLLLTADIGPLQQPTNRDPC
jgi:hypothetical protein